MLGPLAFAGMCRYAPLPAGVFQMPAVKHWPRWRNWQTRQLEVLVPFIGNGGSSPLLGISFAISSRFEGAENTSGVNPEATESGFGLCKHRLKYGLQVPAHDLASRISRQHIDLEYFRGHFVARKMFSTPTAQLGLIE